MNCDNYTGTKWQGGPSNSLRQLQTVWSDSFTEFDSVARRGSFWTCTPVSCCLRMQAVCYHVGLLTHLCRLSWLWPLAAPSDRPDGWLQRLDNCLDTSVVGNKMPLCQAGDDLCTHSRPVKYTTHSMSRWSEEWYFWLDLRKLEEWHLYIQLKTSLLIVFK